MIQLARKQRTCFLQFLYLLLLVSAPSLRSLSLDEANISPTSAEAIRKLEEELRSELDHSEGEEYTNEWAVYIPGGEKVADIVAHDLGFENTGQIGSLEGYYLLKKNDHHNRSKRHAVHHTNSLLEDNRVDWAEQQRAKVRMKRDLIEKRDEEKAYQTAAQFNDIFWKDQWYLYDSRSSTDLPKMDLHVIPLWAKNYTGAGVVVTMLDDGIEYNHTDLADNYDPKASYDFNGNDDDPFPRYDETDENKHGTRCAGEVAMVANNGFCGVGVAYNSRIGGIRMLDGTVTDSVEARALTFNNDYIDIYSASWGPKDDGQTMELPGRLALAALEKGVKVGRGGKGVIYVWASGNGGMKGDNCGCDGYAASIYTISISSASQQSQSPWYSERCPATMATTFSSGSNSEQQIVASELRNRCTIEHSGTSASAPLAAGIFALVLEVNPDLTWRDLQHLVAWTSEYDPLRENPEWQLNGAGFWVNSRFGFGLLNAAALANAADKSVFHHVPNSTTCTAELDPVKAGLPRFINSGETVTLTLETDGCAGDSEVNYLEHVILTLDMLHSRRGNLEIFLTSPAGTDTQLLTKRPRDVSKGGINSWPFMSVHTWGENPRGVWKLRIVDELDGFDQGVIRSVSLTLHGTRDQPHHVRKAGGRRVYNMDYNKVINTKKTVDQSEEDGYEVKSLLLPNDELLNSVISRSKLQDDKGINALYDLQRWNTAYWPANIDKLQKYQKSNVILNV